MFDWLYPYADKLRFPDEIEARFREDYHVNTIATMRFAMVLGIILYCLFGILDIYAVPISLGIIWFIRYVIVVPFFLFLLIASYSKRFQKHVQLLVCIGTAVAGLGVVAGITIARETEFASKFYFSGLLLVSLWAYGLSRLRFYYAVLANLIIFVGYEYAGIIIKQQLASENGLVIFILHNFFFLAANVIGMYTSYHLERYTRRDFLQKYTIQEQRDQADRLLYNVLPESIAERLKQSSETIAEEFNSASVLFADIVNFTPISARFAPHEVVDMLNDLFSRFDELVDKYDVEKIQVAGDAYMVAAGVPTPRHDHATVLAELALDMLDCVRQGDFLGGKHPVEIRIGLNSGSLLAGVIGRKKYYYTLWGDMVNIASRMQSHGESGRIQITRATYELLKDDFECQHIGKIDIKGKGKMEAWHLIARKEERSISHA
ncbi:MAG TPA: adenylate/guanylate cyclase domain-containing protein [Anaerolineales bacterium]|nr:adenylate/guanylate cyclase domain-containing protein [Anaerolineales bacterium]HLO29375.1 adenylate/guanylate cyclase domain-containing protein [Anaerolineales bacterium]